MNNNCLVPDCTNLVRSIDCTNLVRSIDSYYCEHHAPKKGTYYEVHLGPTPEDPNYDPNFMPYITGPDQSKDILTEGRKDDQGKLPMTLISPSAMRKLAKILQLGAAKYSRRNWEKGLSFSRVADALQRHFDDWREEIEQGNPDSESGESHIFHVLCNAMFLSHFMANYNKYKDFDDRQK